MSLTKIGSIGINTGIAFAGVTTIVTLNTANDALSIGATVNVGSGITLGASGDIFATGVSTFSGNLKVGSGVTISPDGDGFYTGVVTATSYAGSGANLTGIDTDLVSDTSPQLGGNLDVNTKNIVFGDSGGATDDRLTFGAGTDLSIYHNGSDSYIEDSGTGALVVKTSQLSIRNAADDEQLAKFIQDSAVELYHNNSKKFETTSAGVSVSGSLSIPDSQVAAFGDGEDFKIYHDGTNNYLRSNGLKNIYINPKDTDVGIKVIGDGAVELYHDNSKKFETTANGAEITGQLDITGGFVSLDDNYSVVMGTGGDAQLYHSGTHQYLLNTTGNIYLMPKSGEYSIGCYPDAQVELYHNNTKKFETHDVGTIFTEAGSGATQAAIKVNTTLDTYGSVTVRNKSDVEVNTSAFQVENASNGANETNLLLRSVNLGSTAYSHGLYAAKSHRFAVSNNTTPMVQVDLDGLKFNNDQASANALDDYEEGTWTPSFSSGETLSTYVAQYTKIGRQVTAYCYIYNFSDLNGNSNRFSIEGLPFNASGGNYHGGGYIAYMAVANYSAPLLPIVAQTSSYGYFHRQDGVNATWQYQDMHNVGNGQNGQMVVTFVYDAAT